MPRSSNRQAPCVPPHVRAQSDGLPSLACRGEGGDAAAGGRGQGTNRPEGGVGAAIVESLGWGVCGGGGFRELPRPGADGASEAGSGRSGRIRRDPDVQAGNSLGREGGARRDSERGHGTTAGVGKWRWR